jgi:phage shock protein C
MKNAKKIAKEAPIEQKRVYRSRQDKIVAGVCGGIAEFYNADPVWIRLLAVLLAFASGMGIVLYLVLWIIMPKNPSQKESSDTSAELAASRLVKKVEKKRGSKAERVIGIILIIVGAVLVMKNLFHWFTMSYVWAVALVLVGAYLVLKKPR